MLAFLCVLTSNIERKITLAGDACSRPPIIIRSHDLHVGNIKGAVGEITSYHEEDYSFPFFWLLWVVRFLTFWPSLFVSPMMVLAIDLLLDFCLFLCCSSPCFKTC